MKKIEKLIFSILIAIAIIVTSCATPETVPPKKPIDPAMFKCCPQGAGLLKAPVNNEADSTDEYAPYIYYGANEDILWFTTDRNYKDSYKDKKYTALPAELLFCTRPSSNRFTSCPNEGWSDPQRFSTDNNDFDKLTRGCVAIYSNKMIIVAERPLNEAQPFNHGTSYNLDLWELDYSSRNTTTSPKPIIAVNSPYWESQPSISPNGNFLVFVSNRPLEGKIAKDQNIWYSYKSEGQWQEPKILMGVNTDKDEITPHWGVDGKLYFSSNYADGKTFDIYVGEIKILGDEISIAHVINFNDISRKSGCGGNTQLNINSPKNEMFPFVTPNGLSIYYSSDKEGGYGKLDLYACSLPAPCVKLKVTAYLTVNGFTQPIKDLAMKVIGNNAKTIEFKSDEEVRLDLNTAYEGYHPVYNLNCFECKYSSNKNFSTNFTKDTILYDTIKIECQQRAQRKIDLNDSIMAVPYFVTGYWMPNTSKNLKTFTKRIQEGTLNKAAFIESDDYNYDKASKEIDGFFEKNIFSEIDRVAKAITECPSNLALKISIHGFTDPCKLVPGKYQDEELYFEDMLDVNGNVRARDVKIPSNYEMWKHSLPTQKGSVYLPDEGQNGNIILSMLRAFYTYKTIDDEMLSRSVAYNKLVADSAIKFDYQGFGVFDKVRCGERYEVKLAGNDLSNNPLKPEPCNKPQNRRIIIYLEIVNKEDLAYHKITPCGERTKDYNKYLTNKIKKIEEEEKEIIAEKEKTKKVEQIAESYLGGCAGPTCWYLVFAETESAEAAEEILSLVKSMNFDARIAPNDALKVISETFSNEEEAQKTKQAFSEKLEIIKKLFKEPKKLKLQIKIVSFTNEAMQE